MEQYRCFTTNCGCFSRELKNSIGVSDPVTTRLNGVEVGDIEPIFYNGLWDTGATNTLITNKVAIALNLSVIDRETVYTPSGSHEANVYFIDLWLPNKVIIPSLRVLEGVLSGGYDLLIGMDVISTGDFAVSNHEKKTVFSFRAPSLTATDYVAQLKSLQQAHSDKSGRNNLCPCGSGRKYKKCCGK